ncbi:hypothetical protein EX895_002180 [Sporisorium graminicola]|uniref:Uncharacterized protein n=1 Tax=Sporisorium graminicola TaxID=280036 RepID=A0A4V6EU28_9BASI|nr:hypothetical protein EX895_002180 [Sporisorium graminicola]TKY88939.1 hypothetical protein EX895_002180 [Sporisorium graminicola]
MCYGAGLPGGSDTLVAYSSATLPAAFQDILPQQPALVEALPQWFMACTALANKYDLLLFPMPLETWEDRQLCGVASSRADVGLRCITPSYVDPPPTMAEVTEMLDLLLLELRTFPGTASALITPTNSALDFQRQNGEAPLSDEKPHLPLVLNESCSIDGNGGIETSSSRPALPASPHDLSIDIAIDNSDASSEPEPEPDFSFDFAVDDCSDSSQIYSNLYRHKDDPYRFDPFLFSPCHCHATPRAQQLTLSPLTSHTSVNDTSDETRVKDEHASWEECMSDVIDDASIDAMTSDWLRLNPVDLLG